MRPFALSSAFASVIFGIAYASWVILELWYSLSSLGKDGHSRDRGTLLITVVTNGVFQPLVWYSALHIPGLAIGGNQPLIFLSGVCLMLFGTCFRFWAIRTLGKYFTPTVFIQRGHQLVTDGPYRHLRHPSYTGLLATIVGIGIALGNWGSVAFCLLSFSAILVRMHVEEQALLQHFGTEYQTYVKRTARLIPRIY
jgi:protein-S-isoprenylcysteine O-methyltransferase